MPLKKLMKGVPSEACTAKGYLSRDWNALTACQQKCTNRFGTTVQIEQEAYLSQHPEIKIMLQMFISKMVCTNKRKGILKEAVSFFDRPSEELDKEIKERLGLKKTETSYKGNINKKKYFEYEDIKIENDLREVINSCYPIPFYVPSPTSESLIDTVSSSFLTLVTSDTTVPTPEPIPTPEPTLSETMMVVISNTVDKAIFLHVDDEMLRYDTAYVELIKAVEEAMEIPVIEIREDIAELLYNAYKMFEIDIMEKERAAAEAAWEKRMRKKLKKTLRLTNNFKGYETPPTPKSEVSSHESYKIPPPRPCECAPIFNYNRYPKDRFGVYLPSGEIYSKDNVTATPAISLTNV